MARINQALPTAEWNPNLGQQAQSLPITAQGYPAQGYQPNGRELREAKAFELLDRTLDKIRNVDGRRRLVMVGSGKSRQLFTRSRFAAFFMPDATAAAGIELSEGLAPLRRMYMRTANKEQIDTIDAIFRTIKVGDASAGDIFKLDRLLQKVRLHEKLGAEDLAWQRLTTIHHAARAADLGSTIAWSAEMGDVEFKKRNLTSQAERKELGKQLAAEFAPLTATVRKKGTKKDNKGFDECMDQIEAGKFQAGTVIELAQLVSRVKMPEKHARAVLARLTEMGKESGSDDSNVLVDDDRLDFKFKWQWIKWDSECKAVGPRLAEALRGLRPLFSNHKHPLHKHFEDVWKKIEQGTAKSKDICRLDEIVRRHDDPLEFARDELRDLTDKSVEAGPNKGFIWNMGVEITKWVSFWDASGIGRFQAHKRLWFRLAPLQELFPDDNKPINVVGRMLLEKFNPGANNRANLRFHDDFTATSTDVLHLQMLVDVKTAMNHDDREVADQPVQESLMFLDHLAAADDPQGGERIRVKLLALQQLVEEQQPDQINRLQKLLSNIANEDKDARLSIAKLVELVRRLRPRYGSSPIGPIDIPPQPELPKNVNTAGGSSSSDDDDLENHSVTTRGGLTEDGSQINDAIVNVNSNTNQFDDDRNDSSNIDVDKLREQQKGRNRNESFKNHLANLVIQEDIQMDDMVAHKRTKGGNNSDDDNLNAPLAKKQLRVKRPRHQGEVSIELPAEVSGHQNAQGVAGDIDIHLQPKRNNQRGSVGQVGSTIPENEIQTIGVINDNSNDEDDDVSTHVQEAASDRSYDDEINSNGSNIQPIEPLQNAKIQNNPQDQGRKQSDQV